MAAMRMWIILLPLASLPIFYAENDTSLQFDEEDQPPEDRRLYRAAGEPCSMYDFSLEWYPVEDDPTKFLYCDLRAMSLVEGMCNVVRGVQRIFDERIERCVMPSWGKQRSAGIPKSSGLHEPCLQNTDCLDNMYCPAGICECLSGYFPRNQECAAAIPPGETGCADDAFCHHYWPTTRCNQGTCECTVPSGLSGYTAGPQQTAEGIVCVLTVGNVSLCPLPIPSTSTPTIAAGGPAVFTATGLQCTIVNGIGEIEVNSAATTSWSDMVVLVPTPSSNALCCPNRAHTCMQPKPTSTGGETRYWYNQATGGCETFQWDGTSPWANNFNTEEHCLSYCGGICRRGYTQVTNGKSQICDAQCTGDKECRDVASAGHRLCCQSKSTICSPDGGKTPVQGNDLAGVGPTSHLVARWRYDQGRCVSFQYTGWGGNYNNFATQRDCDRFCVASVCQHGEPLRDANDDPQACGQGCPSSFECTNNICCPKRQTVCVQPKLIGSCSQFTMAYWYNAASQTCEEFRYSGCGGNDNNFESYDECMAHCRGIRPQPLCGQGPADKDASGNYYTCTAGAVATGCRENFECLFDASTQAAGCCPRKAYTCRIAPDTGAVCGIPSTRWYFDASSQTCQSFTYNGCDGNSNNFAARQTCEKYCGSGGCPFGGEPYRVNGAVCSAQDDCPSGYACDTVWIGTNSVKYCCQTRDAICRQPQSQGTRCGAQSQRYYYSSYSRQCLPFTYLGCDGNENNFDTLRQCNNFCGSVGCLAGEIALLYPNTEVTWKCNPSVKDNCQAGYNCRKNSITAENICCGSNDMGVCPAGQKAYVNGRTGDPRECQPSNAFSCGEDYLCQFGRNGRYYCCGTYRVVSPLVSARCPLGSQPRILPSGQPQTCQLGVRTCPIGYDCMNGGDGYICCTNIGGITTSVNLCPDGFSTYLNPLNQQPQQCLTTLCPSGSQCKYSQRVRNYYCCVAGNVVNNVINTGTMGTIAVATPLIFGGQITSFTNICPDGYSTYANPLTLRPQQCLTALCPSGSQCKYSQRARYYYCCVVGNAGAVGNAISYAVVATTGGMRCWGKCNPGGRTNCISGYVCLYVRTGYSCCYVGRRYNRKSSISAALRPVIASAWTRRV